MGDASDLIDQPNNGLHRTINERNDDHAMLPVTDALRRRLKKDRPFAKQSPVPDCLARSCKHG